MTNIISTLNKIQPELKIWTGKNFPENTEKEPLLGIGEELGELVEVFSKYEDNPNEPLTAELTDAIADTLIYAADFANQCGFVFGELTALCGFTTTRNRALLELFKHLGKLNHHTLKRSQGIRGSYGEHTLYLKQHLTLFVGAVDYMACWYGIDAAEAVADTWDKKVKKRDWLANKENGAI